MIDARILQQLEQGSEYASEVMRAINLTAHEATMEESAAVEEFVTEFADAGLRMTLGRYLDAEHSPASLRWRVTIHTERGDIEVDIDRPSEWRERLRDLGWPV